LYSLWETDDAEAGAATVVQHSSGLNPALVEARAALAGPDDRLLVLPGDLPGVGVEEVAALLAAADAKPGPLVLLAADRFRRGTNALLLDPAWVIEPAFGGDSRDAHAGLAARVGAAFVEVAGLLELDVDTPDDLLLAEAERPEAIHAH